jgi:hypothetical protein
LWGVVGVAPSDMSDMSACRRFGTVLVAVWNMLLGMEARAGGMASLMHGKSARRYMFASAEVEGYERLDIRRRPESRRWAG